MRSREREIAREREKINAGKRYIDREEEEETTLEKMEEGDQKGKEQRGREGVREIG